jgi:hypothetical protein
MALPITSPPACSRRDGRDRDSDSVSPDGLNINLDCGSTKPAALRETVKEQGADLGIAFDGDGDRVIMVDHRGEILDGDELLFIIARDRLRTGSRFNAVVGTLMTNLGLEMALRALGLDLHRAKVGDRYVMERLLAEKLILGGENSGHIICLDRTTTGDGIISALQVLIGDAAIRQKPARSQGRHDQVPADTDQCVGDWGRWICSELRSRKRSGRGEPLGRSWSGAVAPVWDRAGGAGHGGRRRCWMLSSAMPANWPMWCEIPYQRD